MTLLQSISSCQKELVYKRGKKFSHLLFPNPDVATVTIINPPFLQEFSGISESLSFYPQNHPVRQIGTENSNTSEVMLHD